jgi:hypothetical protein
MTGLLPRTVGNTTAPTEPVPSVIAAFGLWLCSLAGCNAREALVSLLVFAEVDE